MRPNTHSRSTDIMAERWKWYRNIYALILVTALTLAAHFADSLEGVERLMPTVLIASPVRNKAHSIPYFLACIEDLHYPKDRIALWFRSDHNTDNSSAQVEAWLEHVKPLYHSVDFEFDDSQTHFSDQRTHTEWSVKRFRHVMQLRQQALDAGRRMWADFVLLIDADVLLKNPDTLLRLVEQKKTVIAPLLNVTASDSYANFWGDMDQFGYYRRSENYFDIKERKETGVFEVAMVHSAVLVNLQHGVSSRLAYFPPPVNYNGPFDDIIVFAKSAHSNGIQMHLLNEEFYGYVPIPMEEHNTVEEEAEQFIHIKMECIVDDIQLRRIEYIYPPPLVKNKDTLGFDQVYMINLKRRPDRREKMLKCFEELGIAFKDVEAVDGKLLNDSYLDSLKVRMLPGYADPYHGRPLTKGEIGCFLSHYFIWLDGSLDGIFKSQILENGYNRVLVFEDDIRFEPYFRKRLFYIMEEVRHIRLDWDLIYLGRRRMNPKSEIYVKGTKLFVLPHYTYWTISYLLTHKGARKLVDIDPLSRLMAVDEFIPVMFDKHPNYLGRKKLRWQDEAYVQGSERLVFPHYSYWTLSYLLTRKGVNKLLSHDPLSKLLPIDEYIPILFDRHIEEEWKQQFSPRNLKAFSVEPLLVYPTHYTGEPGYITDTDHSQVVNFGEDGYIKPTSGEGDVDGAGVDGEGDGSGAESNSPLESSEGPASKLGGTVSGPQRGDMGDLPTPKDEL